MGSHALKTRYVPQQLTVPAGTASSAPTTLSWNLGAVILGSLEVMIPKGHAGLTGLAVTYSGQQLLPWVNAGGWLIGNDLDRRFTMQFEVGRPITLSAYNTDIFAHTFYLLAEVTDLGTAQSLEPLGLLNLNVPG